MNRSHVFGTVLAVALGATVTAQSQTPQATTPPQGN